MNCDTCQTLLLDLLDGELQPSVRESAEAHVRQCPRCSTDLQRLRDGMQAADLLPRLEPPSEVRDAVREAARAELQRPTAAREPDEPASETPAWWWRLLSRFGELATSPQVAMATVLLLMIAVGLYYLPAGQEPHASHRLDAEVLEPESTADGPAASATALPTSEREASEEEALDRAEASPEPPPAAEAPGEGRGAAGGRSARRAPQGSSERVARRRQKEGQPTVDRQRAERRARGGAGAGAAAFSAETNQRAPAPKAAPAPSEEVAEDLLDAARRALEAGRSVEGARAARRALARGADPKEAHALAAEGFRRAGRCDLALPHYRKLRASAPARALPGGARCLIAQGKLDEAEVWIRKAEQSPSLRDQAAQLRALLEQQRARSGADR